jgi:hypothetical protein
VSIQLHRYKLSQVDPFLFVGSREHGLNAAERAQPSFELSSEGLDRLAAARRLPGGGLDDREQIARAVLQFGEKDLLAILERKQIVDIGHGAHPIGVAAIHRTGSGLVPAILAVPNPPHAVLGIVFAGPLRVGPGGLGRLTILGMDRIEPTQAEAFVQAEAGEFDPLGASPGAGAVRVRKEDELRNADRQQAETLLALA